MTTLTLPKFVIMEDGSLKPCEILSDNLGKITNKKDFSIRKLFLSKKAKNLRSWIVKTKTTREYKIYFQEKYFH